MGLESSIKIYHRVKQPRAQTLRPSSATGARDPLGVTELELRSVPLPGSIDFGVGDGVTAGVRISPLFVVNTPPESVTSSTK